MQNKPANWDAIFAAPHKVEYQFVIDGETYGGADVCGTPVITKLLLDKPSIGRTCTGSLSITVYPITNIPKAATVNPYCRLIASDGSTTDWVSQGKFYVSTRSGSNPLTLSCVDAMVKAGATYLDKSTFEEWPVPMQDVVDEIAQIMEVEIDPRTSINSGSDYMVYFPNEDTLISEILGMIGAAHGGNWIVSEEGNLRLVPIASPKIDADQTLYKAHKGFRLTGATQTITRITLVDSADNAFTSGDDSGNEISAQCDYATQAIADNLCALDGDGAINVYGTTYTPYELTGAYIDPCIELGDTLSITSKSGIHQIVVQSLKISCTVACTASSSANTEEEIEYPYISARDLSISRAIRSDKTYFGNRLTRSDGFISELLVNGEAKARLTANASIFSMQSFKDGVWTDHIYFDTATGKYTISADVSITGIVTFDSLSNPGQTTIDGGNITTGTIQSEDGRIVFDLSAGTLTIGDKNLESALSAIETSISLLASSQMFTRAAGASAYSPSSITLSAEAHGNITSYIWYKDGVQITDATESALTITPDAVSGNATTYKVVGLDDLGNTYSDVLTVAKLADGQDGAAGQGGKNGYTVLLSNEYIEVPVSVNRKPTTSKSYVCNISVYDGVTALAPVSANPAAGQVAISISHTPTGIATRWRITESAFVLVATVSTDVAIADSDAITLTATTSDMLTMPASIVVHANLNDVVVTQQTQISTLDDAISLRVTETAYHNTVPTYSTTNPALSWTTAQKNTNIGYLWYDVDAESVKRWDGTSWAPATPENAPAWATVAQSSIELNSRNIDLKVSKDGIISAINLSTEGVKISGDKISLEGSEISLEGTITANGAFEIDTEGNMTATGGAIGGFSISESELIGGGLRLLSSGSIDVGALAIRAESVNFPEIIVEGASYAELSIGAPGGVYIGGTDAFPILIDAYGVYLDGSSQPMAYGQARCYGSWQDMPYDVGDATAVAAFCADSSGYIIKTRYNYGWQWCIDGSSSLSCNACWLTIG